MRKPHDLGTPGPSGPLEGLRVLDFTQFLAGPFATQILGDLGADVLKIESPAGDLTRVLPPHFAGGDSVYFHANNRNKRSICVDLKAPEARAIVLRLIARSDVVMENFRSGVLNRLGFDVAEIRSQQPRLIWCSITGFGQDSSFKTRPAYDMIVQAMSGGMSLTGEDSGRPVRSGIPIGDLAAGLNAVIGVLAALHQRDQVGHGDAVDVAMLDSLLALLNYQGAYFLHSGQVPGRQGRGHDSIPTYRSFTASDGVDVVITANTEGMWKSLCQVLGVEDLAADPRFRTNADRYRHRRDLWQLLDTAFAQRAAEEWVEELIAAGVPAAVVADVGEALTSDYAREREMVWNLGDGDRAVRVPGNPIRMSASRRRQQTAPPHLGRDSRRVLEQELGMAPHDVDALISRGVVHVPEATEAQPAAAVLTE